MTKEKIIVVLGLLIFFGLGVKIVDAVGESYCGIYNCGEENCGACEPGGWKYCDIIYCSMCNGSRQGTGNGSVGCDPGGGSSSGGSSSSSSSSSSSGGDPCAGNTNCGECGNPACCTPSCTSPLCGQGDGCGGTCSSADNYWTYGACSYGTFSRTNTNLCQGNQTQSCIGTISGYFFDASNYDSCPSDFSTAPVMENGTIEAASSTTSYMSPTDTSGLYSIVARSPDAYGLTVLPREPGITFISTPKFICDGGSVTFSGVSDIATRNYGFWRIYGGWFNSTGGGIYGGLGITENIPASSPVQALIDEAAGTGEAGLVYTGAGSINLGTNPKMSISLTGINSEGTGYTGDRADYTYFLAKMGTYEKSSWNGEGKPAYDQGANDFVIYTRKADSTINFVPTAGQKMIFLIDGDVTINTDLEILIYANNPAFLAVISNGTITFKKNVERADGWYVGNQLVFESLNDKTNEKPFMGQGSFVGWSAISLLRDRGLTNNSEPTEKFVFRPDFMINAPTPMTSSYFVWRQGNP